MSPFGENSNSNSKSTRFAVVVLLCTLAWPDTASGTSLHELYDSFTSNPLSRDSDAPSNKSSFRYPAPRHFPRAQESPKLVSSPQHMCTSIEDARFDCWPETKDATEEKCLNRGCCWKPAKVPFAAPNCFFPQDYDGYKVTNVTSDNAFGFNATLMRNSSSFYPNDIKTLLLQFEYFTDDILRFKIFDPSSKRFEAPLNLPTRSRTDKKRYKVVFQGDPFSFHVVRQSTKEVVFDTRNTAPLIFTDQYIQMATQLTTKYAYGFGEHRGPLLQNVTSWKRLVFWNKADVPTPDNNGYGSHPFLLNLENERDMDSNTAQKNSHGIFLLNSNVAEVSLQPFGESGAVTYRTLGGVLDFFIMLGPEQNTVIEQYTSLIGRPYFPPFWSLGFHLCKFGYKSSDDLLQVIKRNRAANMPYDVQWTDIDYMEDRKDWTYDKKNFSTLPDVVKDLHNNSQRYIIILDPGISSEQPRGTYQPFDDGIDMDVFVKAESGDILIGKVGQGLIAFPDFFHPNATAYWYKQASSFHKNIPFDGLWIDMNEPTSFVDGSTVGCPDSRFNNPPYLPPSLDSGSIIIRTICPSSKHYISEHYNLHNMYGWSMADVNRKTLNSIFPSKRTPLITRSSFPGTGANAGHWLGDNAATFDDLAYSIPGILNFNMFGVAQIGADICGFHDATTPELCTRWTQLGAFYPFMRNHDSANSPVQDPASFDSPYKDYMRSALQLRYKLLSVLYTLFYEAHTTGIPIVRPLLFEYPGTEAIDKQFMWGSQLLISPALQNGQRKVNAYFPDDVWYDFYDGTKVATTGQNVVLDSPLDHINVHIRGGSILTLLPNTTRTDDSRKEKFIIVIAPDGNGAATGNLFWDDGESMDSVTAYHYSLISFDLRNGNQIDIAPLKLGYTPSGGINMQTIVALNVNQMPSNVTINGKSVKYTYDKDRKKLTIDNLDQNLLTKVAVSWS